MISHEAMTQVSELVERTCEHSHQVATKGNVGFDEFECVHIMYGLAIAVKQLQLEVIQLGRQLEEKPHS